MAVSVECDEDSNLFATPDQDVAIVRGRESDLTRMQHVQSICAENLSRCGGEILIKQQSVE